MRIKQFLLHFKTYGYQVYCIIGYYLEDNQPFSKSCKGEWSPQCTRFLGAISSLACFIHMANTYIVNHHLFACKKYLRERTCCEYFLLPISLCCMDAMAFQVVIQSLIAKNSQQEPATLYLSKSRNKVVANKRWFLQYM